MPRAPTSSSSSPGILSQCKPLIVFESEMTSEIGRELEFPNTYGPRMSASTHGGHLVRRTPMATTKLRGLCLRPKAQDTPAEHT